MTILTPKGYSRARGGDREAEQPAQPATTPPSGVDAASTAAASGAPGPGSEPQFTFPPQVAGINCPSCNTPFPVAVFSVVDVGQDPVLKSILLSGQLNVAVCPRCGAGGTIGTPLLYHDPEHEFLGVYVPEQVPMKEQQAVIGQLSKVLMNGLPQEARRGYMLTPKQFLNYQSMLEAILEHEGITREMLDRQRRALQLIEQGLAALSDPEGLRLLVQENDAFMDDEFFALLQTVMQSARASGGEDYAQFAALRERLIESTTWGEGVKKQRAAIRLLSEKTTQKDLVQMVVDAEDPRIVDALVTAGRSLVDYVFFQELTARAERAGQLGDAAESKRLVALREQVLALTERLRELDQMSMQQTSQILGEILAANDIAQAVAERAHLIDENFLTVLAAQLDRAEQQGSGAAAKRLQQVWDATMSIIDANTPPPIRLVQDLLNADYPGETRKILSENRDLITDDLLEGLTALAEQLSGEGDPESAKLVRQIRSQAQLMR